jgi:flagellar basal-body rod protein FlgB
MPWSLFNDDLLPLLENSLTWQSRRHEVIAGNVANLDTPNYTRKELNFQDMLNTYLHGGPQVHLAATHPVHIQGDGSLPVSIQDTWDSVDIDREMVQMAENALSYQASAQMLTKKLESLRATIEGDR